MPWLVATKAHDGSGIIATITTSSSTMFLGISRLGGTPVAWFYRDDDWRQPTDWDSELLDWLSHDDWMHWMCDAPLAG